MRIEVRGIIPVLHPVTRAKIITEFAGSNVVLSCKHEKLPPQNQPKTLLIPRFMELDEKLGECIGLYYGDGTKNRNHLEFCNSSIELANIWLNHLKFFGITANKLHFSVKLSENSIIKYNVGDSAVIDFWKRLTGTYPCKIFTVKNYGHRISNYVQKFGSIRMCYNDAMLSIFYNALIDNVPKLISMSRPFLVGFVRGVIAAEGNVNLRGNGSLSLLRIAGTPEERIFFSKILHRHFGIESLEDSSNQIYIKGYNYLTIVKKFNLHALHPFKCKSFEAGYAILKSNINKKSDKNVVLKNKIAIRLLGLFEGDEELGCSDIIRCLGVSNDYVRIILNGHSRRVGSKAYKYHGLVKLGFIRKSKKGRRNVCKITVRGKKFLLDSGNI